MPGRISSTVFSIQCTSGDQLAARDLFLKTATYLARDHGKRVLLVDFDPQLNASLSLMTEPVWGKWVTQHGSMADVLEAEGTKSTPS